MSTDNIVQLTPLQVGRTYGQLIDHFEKRFSGCGPEFRAMALEVIREVVSDMASRYDWSWLHSAGTIVTIGGQAEYPLAADFAFLDQGQMTIGNHTTITARPLSQVRKFEAQESYRGSPRYFAQSGEAAVVFYPIPDSAYTVLYDYSKSFADTFSETDRPPMPPAFDFALYSGIEERLRADDNQFDPATGWVGRRYERQVNQLIFRESTGRNTQALPDLSPPGADGYYSSWGGWTY